MSIKALALAAAIPACLAAAPAFAFYPFEARSQEGLGWSDPWVYGHGHSQQIYVVDRYAGYAPHAHGRWRAAPAVYPAYDVYSRDPRRGRLHNYRSSGVTWGSFGCEHDPFMRMDPRCLSR